MICAIIFSSLCAVEDCVRKKIDSRLLFLGMAAGALTAGWRIFQGREDWYGILLGVLPGVILLGISVMTEGKIGRGDGEMALALGLFLGWELCIYTLCTALFLSAVFAGAGLALRKLSKNSRLAFAPFLLAALILMRIFYGGGF